MLTFMQNLLHRNAFYVGFWNGISPIRSIYSIRLHTKKYDRGFRDDIRAWGGDMWKAIDEYEEEKNVEETAAT